MEYFTLALPIHVTDWSTWIMSQPELIRFRGIHITALVMFTTAQKSRCGSIASQ